MKIGTKSLLFGAHAFWLHPICVAAGWIKLYGFPFDPRTWLAFLVHDWGRFGQADMDGPEGLWHPILGAMIMGGLFGPEWGDFSLFHSRQFCNLMGKAPSKLCYADKVSFCYQIKWFYLLTCKLTGELYEYMQNAKNNGFISDTDSASVWYDRLSLHTWKEFCETER